MFTIRSATAGLVALALLAAHASGQFTLTTTFAGGNSFNGNMFDIGATNSVVITGFDIHIPTGQVSDVEIYTLNMPGPYIGNEANPSAWTLVGSATGVVSAGTGLPTPVPITLSVPILAGQLQGFYVTLSNGGTFTYTNGTAQGALFTSDANIDFYEGHGGAYPFNLTNVPRVFNGNIHYSLGAAPAAARIDFAPGSQLAINVPAGTVTGSATIVGYEGTNGMYYTNPVVDPIVNGSMTIVGTYGAGNPNTLFGLILPITNVTLIASPGADELGIVSTLSQNPAAVPDTFFLAGALGCVPTSRRSVAGSPNSVNRIGTGSAVLDDLAMRLPASSMTLLTRVTGGSHELESLAIDYVATPTVTASNFDTSGNGGFQIGAVGLNPNDRLLNIFAVNPAGQPGAGPFFGIDFGVFQLQQLYVPVGLAPFNTSTTGAGNFFYATPSNIIPPSTLDLVMIAFDPAGTTLNYISPVHRVVF